MMSKEREKAILQAYFSGMKTTDIVQKFKASTSSIPKLLKKYGVENKKCRNGNLSRSIYNEFILIEVPMETIAKWHGISEKEAKQIYREERNKRLVDDYVNGSKIDDICVKYNLSNMAVYKILNKKGIKRREPRNRLSENHLYSEITEEMKNVIVQDYQSGILKVNEMLQKYNISKHQLYTLLYEKGCQTRGKTQLSENDKDTIKEMYKNGMTITALSREYKVSRALISYIVGGK